MHAKQLYSTFGSYLLNPFRIKKFIYLFIPKGGAKIKTLMYLYAYLRAKFNVI